MAEDVQRGLSEILDRERLAELAGAPDGLSFGDERQSGVAQGADGSDSVELGRKARRLAMHDRLDRRFEFSADGCSQPEAGGVWGGGGGFVDVPEDGIDGNAEVRLFHDAAVTFRILRRLPGAAKKTGRASQPQTRAGSYPARV